MLDYNYKNKVAVITGGSGALGSAMAKGGITTFTQTEILRLFK